MPQFYDHSPWAGVLASRSPKNEATAAASGWPNAPFDEQLLRQTAERHGLAFPDLQWRCVQRDYGGRKALVVAAVDVGLTVSDAHGALTDAKRTVDVMRAMPAARKRTFYIA